MLLSKWIVSIKFISFEIFLFILHHSIVCKTLRIRRAWLRLLCSNHKSKKSLKIPKGHQNPDIEEEQTAQWPKEKGQKNKERSTKHRYKTKDRVTRTPLKPGGELRCSGRVGSSCSTSDTRRSLESRYQHQVLMLSDTYTGLCVSPVSLLYLLTMSSTLSRPIPTT